MILHLPKSTLRKAIFNPNAQTAQFYNVVEDLAQAPCAMSTLEVLQSCPTQRKNLLTALGALDLDNTNLIHFNVENYKSRLPHKLTFHIITKVVGKNFFRILGKWCSCNRHLVQCIPYKYSKVVLHNAKTC